MENKETAENEEEAQGQKTTRLSRGAKHVERKSCTKIHQKMLLNPAGVRPGSNRQGSSSGSTYCTGRVTIPFIKPTELWSHRQKICIFKQRAPKTSTGS